MAEEPVFSTIMNADSRRPLPMLWVPLLLIMGALALRWLKLETTGMDLMPNFSPFMALAFTGTLVFPRLLAWWLWPLCIVVVDALALGAAIFSSAETLLPYALYFAAAWGASWLRGRCGVWQAMAGVVSCGLVFNAVTNTLSWWLEPQYSKSLAGWMQALTTGLPSYAPTWTFYRNSFLSDLAFSALLLATYQVEARSRSLPGLRWSGVASV